MFFIASDRYTLQEKNLEELINVVDTVAADRLEYASYIRNTIRQQYQQQSWINKRVLTSFLLLFMHQKEENKSRLEKGLELLPEEDLDDPVFKNSTLTTKYIFLKFVIIGQLCGYVDQL